LREETVGFVGLGAIGAATLRTMLDRVAHPRALILCDVPAKLPHLQALAREVATAFGCRGGVEIVTTTGMLPTRVYDAGFLVGATNAPNVIDIERIQPGTAIIDDSFPLCFDLEKALRRQRTAGDIFVAAGGSVLPPGPIEWMLALPPGLMAFAGDSRLQALLPPSHIITGCMLASLLPAAAGVSSTLGEVTIEECHAYWQAFASLGIEAAPLHCGSWIPSAADITRFKTSLLEAA
jgi:predicted amino acid dehydrogenase